MAAKMLDEVLSKEHETMANEQAASEQADRIIDEAKQKVKQIELDALASEQVLDLNVLHIAQAHITVDHLIESGNRFDAAAAVAADLQNFFSLHRTCRRNGKDDLGNIILSGIV